MATGRSPAGQAGPGQVHHHQITGAPGSSKNGHSGTSDAVMEQKRSDKIREAGPSLHSTSPPTLSPTNLPLPLPHCDAVLHLSLATSFRVHPHFRPSAGHWCSSCSPREGAGRLRAFAARQPEDGAVPPRCHSLNAPLQATPPRPPLQSGQPVGGTGARVQGCQAQAAGQDWNERGWEGEGCFRGEGHPGHWCCALMLLLLLMLFVLFGTVPQLQLQGRRFQVRGIFCPSSMASGTSRRHVAQGRMQDAVRIQLQIQRTNLEPAFFIGQGVVGTG
ncbi:hypothetical protein K456DRAFT_1936260 [Colletotrichum gloeosporioides 23]|nr:hypothetical protein K456DRAFT_1936260 [Colletotrichum gloeosporioides 23]